jgi:putative component of membrane protein insertase Oxa1/YidC/SpoIIIJ protein YidD
MAVKCCNGCVPPKRTPTCKFDGTCGKYAEERAQHDIDTAAKRREMEIQRGITSQKYEGVYRATKKKGRR